MAELAVTHPTLLDLAKSKDPDGTIADVAELLNEEHGVLEDMVFMEGNLETGHRTTVRTGLPAATWRSMYGMVQPTKSTKAQITDNTGMLEAFAEVDKALADLGGNGPAFRLQEDAAHIEGMAQELTNTIFYGNEGSNPAAFTGLSPRFNSLSAENADNIIDAGGVGVDNRSIWLCVWAPKSGFGIVPKGSMAGLQMRDLGEVTLETGPDGTTGRMQAYRTHYRQDAGLTIRDWRYFVRICNIDFSALSADASTGANLPQLMFEAMQLPPNLNGRAVFYAERDVWTKLGQQIENRVSNSTLTVENAGGVMTTRYHGVPLRRVDALSTDEARVT